MKRNKGYRWVIYLGTIGLILTLSLGLHLQTLEPNYQRLTVGEHIRPGLPLLGNVIGKLDYLVSSNQTGLLALNGNVVRQKVFHYRSGTPVALEPGQFDLQVRLFGLIPIKKVQVRVVPSIKLIPGGHSIGVLLQSKGVIVIGQAPVIDLQGRRNFPARAAGIATGDIILEINGQPVNNDNEVAYLLNLAGQSGKVVKLKIKHQGQLIRRSVQPVRCRETDRFRIGLYIRDGAAGVGTLTFYEPHSGKYGALGHLIADASTNQGVELHDGRIVQASIQGIHQGRRGQPGEKVGLFAGSSEISGLIKKNTRFGIYGTLNQQPKNPLYPEPIPVGMSGEVEPGPAEILTVVSGNKIERFKVNIDRVLPQPRPDGKGMVVRITDPRLLQITGGIIQGMSGSPIIQHNRIIGAVTHVFVNDPTRGYGVFIESMLKEAGLMNEQPNKPKSDAA